MSSPPLYTHRDGLANAGRAQGEIARGEIQSCVVLIVDYGSGCLLVASRDVVEVASYTTQGEARATRLTLDDMRVVMRS
jgi:hypothetical protein